MPLLRVEPACLAVSTAGSSADFVQGDQARLWVQDGFGSGRFRGSRAQDRGPLAPGPYRAVAHVSEALRQDRWPVAELQRACHAKGSEALGKPLRRIWGSSTSLRSLCARTSARSERSNHWHTSRNSASRRPGGEITMLQRFLDPDTLASISGLDLVAKTVVDGFVAGLHRSPDFGFSQEFAEYRAYSPGDDLRHVDWNVFARTERAYLKRYRGETNSILTVLLDASNSMKFSSHSVNKMDYARYTAASLFYLAIHSQRDAAVFIVFDDEIRSYIRPSTRQGQLVRLLSGLEHAEPRARTDFAKPLYHFQQFLRRRGMVVFISDFYDSPERIVRTIEPLRFHGNEVVLFHVLDPKEIRPEIGESSTLVDLETQDRIEITPEYVRDEYRKKFDAHVEELRDKARGAGMDYHLLVTDRPLDDALREYLSIRQGRD